MSSDGNPETWGEQPGAAEDATWSCKIGPVGRGDLPPGSDPPMREWAHDLDEAEWAVVKNRLPRPRVFAAEARKRMDRALGAIGTDLDPDGKP